ncbi:M16 family metallopeptidase [Shewanella surugensis]|uniref:Insulinase family protein n=1 Tax=Shewanella surugensis TaxID=212020 RepID=A0ABT0LHK0_9GAMM|nr:pitrilysin family protein [Shewanella surugensis]MCL1127177.1 insulinase family protein [Shewanella surugensis]
MKKWFWAVGIAAVLVACADKPVQITLPKGVVLLETSKQTGSQVGIPFRKYQLANGLTVILHEDHSDPLVTVDVTYHVGSARELKGRSGFAHLFEHMMFQGSEHVADELHFKTVTEAGGTLNGTTNTDRTNYFETVPSNQLEKMLWLESDRMGFFLPALTKQKFEVQRETVKNERAQRIDNQPYGQMGEKFNQAFYPEGHPYSWPVIGWPDDLNRADLDDVKQFFQRWYSPNNATLTIGGDFNEAQTLDWVNKYFGEIPRGPEVEAPKKALVKLDKTQYLSMEDRVYLPLLRIAFPTVYARHSDEAPLDLLANILGGGKTSLLYKNLVKSGYAVQAGVNHPCQELACQFTLYAVANPDKEANLGALEKRMLDSIQEFEKRGVTQEDLDKVKVQFEASTIFGLQSVSGKVSTLAYNQTFAGEPNMIASDLQRYANVTRADVMRVFDTYIKDKPMVVMSVVPMGEKELIAKPDTFVPESTVIAADVIKGTVSRQPVQSSFDRTKMPPAGPALVLKTPVIWKQDLANGIQVMGTQSNETPTIELMIYLNGGHRLVDVNKAGLANLTASMMNESSSLRSNEDLAQALEMLGSHVSFGASDYQSYVQVSCLTSRLDETLAIVEEKLFHPGFKEADFSRVKEQLLQSLQHMQSEPSYLAKTAFNHLLFGDKNALGVNATGTLATVNDITLDDVKAFYREQYTAKNAQFVAVGNLPQTELMPRLKGFSQWSGASSALPPLGQLPELKGGTIYIVDKPDAAQSVIKIGKRALPYDATGLFFKSNLMNYPLGGAFNSRINLNLREDKGYTYGARSFFDGGVEQGYFQVTTSVRTDVTAQSLSELIKEISRYQQSGMTDKELSFMRNSISQSEALDYETPYQKASFMRLIQRYHLSEDFTLKQSEIIKTISKDSLNKLASQELALDDMIILIVGDKTKVETSVRQLGYPIKVLNL